MKKNSESEHISKITKDLISSLYKDTEKGFDDGTGYIQSVKTIIQGLKSYLEKNERLLEFEGLITKLKSYSKQLWIKKITGISGDKSQIESDILYYDYCFEYIFENGEFPL